MNILLIRLRLIGDVIFTTPAVAALRQELPDARLTYLVEPPAAPVVLSSRHLDRVLIAERSGGLSRLRDDLRLARRLRSERFDVVVDFHGGPRSSALAWTTRAPVRIGYRVAGRSWMYTHVVARPRALRPRHSVENQWDLLAPLLPSLAPPQGTANPVEMPEDPVAAASVERRLRAAGLQPSHELVVVHVSAGNPFRRWPESSFAGLLEALLSGEPNRRVILTSGPSDADAARRIAAGVRARPSAGAGTILDAGEWDLGELRALIARAALFIGGDSGPLHIAATTATPIVGIYGPTLPARSAPWRAADLITESVEVAGLSCRPCHQRHCEPGDFRCLTMLSASAVADAAARALRLGRQPADRTVAI